MFSNNSLGPVAQLVSAPPCHGGGPEIKSSLRVLHILMPRYTCLMEINYQPRMMSIELHQLYLNGLEGEVAFWKNWFHSQGSQWPDDYLARTTVGVSPSEILIQTLQEIVSKKNLDSVEICDIGSGPISVAANVFSKSNFQGGRLTLFDPLANFYAKFLSEAGLNLPTPIFGLGETLQCKNTFDIIYARNSIDHSFDAPLAVLNLIDQVRVGGYCVFEHYENEALLENYDGIHHWNFEEIENDSWIWSPSTRINVSDLLSSYCDFEIQTTKDGQKPFITIVIKKNSDLKFKEMSNINQLKSFENTLSLMLP